MAAANHSVWAMSPYDDIAEPMIESLIGLFAGGINEPSLRRTMLYGMLLNIFIWFKNIGVGSSVKATILSRIGVDDILFGIVHGPANALKLATLVFLKSGSQDGVINMTSQSFVRLVSKINLIGVETISFALSNQIEARYIVYSGRYFECQPVKIINSEEENNLVLTFYAFNPEMRRFDYDQPLPIPKTDNFGYDYFEHLISQWESAKFRLGVDGSELGSLCFLTGGYQPWYPRIKFTKILTSNETLLDLFIYMPYAFKGTDVLKLEPSRISIQYVEKEHVDDNIDLNHYLTCLGETVYEFKPNPDNLQLIRLHDSDDSNQHIVQYKPKFMEFVSTSFGHELSSRSFPIQNENSLKYVMKIISEEMITALRTSPVLENVAIHFYAKFMRKMYMFDNPLAMMNNFVQSLGLGGYIFLLTWFGDATHRPVRKQINLQ